MPVTLYGTNVSPPSRAVMMLIEILGIEVTFKEVNLPTREHYKPEYLEKNPLHTVPILEDDDFTIVDSHAIMTYLVSKYGKGDMYPDDIKTRCLVDQRLYFDATVLFPRLRNVIYDIALGKASGPTDMQLKHIEEAYSVAEKYLEKSEYIATDNITVADLACVATISSLHCIVPVEKCYKKLNGWWSRLKEESWYKEKNAPGLATFAVFMSSLLRR